MIGEHENDLWFMFEVNMMEELNKPKVDDMRLDTELLEEAYCYYLECDIKETEAYTMLVEVILEDEHTEYTQQQAEAWANVVVERFV